MTTRPIIIVQEDFTAESSPTELAEYIIYHEHLIRNGSDRECHIEKAWELLAEKAPEHPLILEKSCKLKRCIVCYSEPALYSYIPCGHRCICEHCFPRVPKCPICRTSEAVIRIYDVGEEHDVTATPTTPPLAPALRPIPSPPSPPPLTLPPQQPQQPLLLSERPHLDNRNWRRIVQGLRDYLCQQSFGGIALFGNLYDDDINRYMRSHFRRGPPEPAYDQLQLNRTEVERFFAYILD